MKRHADKYVVSETVNSKATTKYQSCIKRSTVGQVIWKLCKSKLSVNYCTALLLLTSTFDNEGQPLGQPASHKIDYFGHPEPLHFHPLHIRNITKR